MKAFYYSLLLKQRQLRLSGDILRSVYIFLSFCCSLFAGHDVMAQYGAELGKQAVSTLAWEDISSYLETTVAPAIGLTTDGRVYTWGTNIYHTIHANRAGTSQTLANAYQVTPYHVRVPNDETVKKVRVLVHDGSSYGVANTFFCLTSTGKLCAWGINTGLVGTIPGWTLGIPTSFADTVRAKRVPIPLTILGESEFVDFDTPKNSLYWVSVGVSGKAYHIGVGGTTNTSTFAEIPKPSGTDANFKYTRVWVSKKKSTLPIIYLKGNDGKIYYTGRMLTMYALGVPSLFIASTANLTNNEQQAKVALINPREVPFPSGEDITDMEINEGSVYGASFAIATSGKAYVAGVWRRSPNYSNASYLKPGVHPDNYVLAPLKTAPSSAVEVVRAPAGNDSTFYLKEFVEMAMPPGASKVVDIMLGLETTSFETQMLIACDNGKVYWSGTNDDVSGSQFLPGNFLSLVNAQGEKTVTQVGEFSDKCNDVRFANSISRYSWTYEAVNFSGAQKLINTGRLNLSQFFIISQSGRGYVIGLIAANSGVGKVTYTNDGFSSFTTPFPVPIANELLLSCNTSPGTGGPLGEPVSTPGVGVIDCSKTKLYPAPVQGTPSQLSLLVTINVTTIGDFSPITINGSGMSLVSGFDKVTATTTGVQTFHIPIKYDGTTLTNALQFTIGQAGSCAADLTKTPTKAITDIWTLECVPSAGPSLKK